MPKYQVISVGFYDGRIYDPNGKRPVLHTDEALKPMPSWVKPLKGETAAEKGARTKAENKAAKEAAEKAKQDKIEVDAVTFSTTPEQTTKTL